MKNQDRLIRINDAPDSLRRSELASNQRKHLRC